MDRYWHVLDTGDYYSSAKADFVESGDAAFIAWQDVHGAAQGIADAAELLDVLRAHEPGGVSPALVAAARAVRPPVADDVYVERARRLAAGFDFDFRDARGVHRIGTTPKDLSGWDEVSKFAGALIDTGMPAGTVDIVTDTGPVSVTAAEWRAIEVAAAAFRQPIWVASFALAAMDPIPADLENDSHWP